MKIMSKFFFLMLACFSLFSVAVAPTASAQEKSASVDVPAACAAFLGGWVGAWPYLLGQSWMWVPSVDAQCVASYSYPPKEATDLKTAEIKKGVLAVPCGSGICSFSVHGETLWANYSGPSGRSDTVFRKVK